MSLECKYAADSSGLLAMRGFLPRLARSAFMRAKKSVCMLPEDWAVALGTEIGVAMAASAKKIKAAASFSWATFMVHSQGLHER